MAGAMTALGTTGLGGLGGLGALLPASSSMASDKTASPEKGKGAPSTSTPKRAASPPPQAKKKSSPRQTLPEWLPSPIVLPFLEELSGREKIPMAWLLSQLGRAERQDRAIALANPLPGDGLGPARSVQRVIQRSLDAQLVTNGNAYLRMHRDAFLRAQEEYGVPARVIAGILGIETRYGRIMGSFPTVDTLASLGFANERRAEFFRKELAALFVLGRESGLKINDLKGSFAGAMGIPQFMPSSWRNYAVDFDGNKRIDLINSPSDAIGSVGHFLARHGWRRDLPSHLPTAMSSNPLDRPPQLQRVMVDGLEAKHTVGDLVNAQVLDPEVSLPKAMPASLIALPDPDLGELYWVATPNFFAITHYNRSYFYAVSVLSLAQAVTFRS